MSKDGHDHDLAAAFDGQAERFERAPVQSDPAALARRVLEKTPHVLLVGEGARWFALKEGFPLETLTTPESVAL